MLCYCLSINQNFRSLPRLAFSYCLIIFVLFSEAAWSVEESYWLYTVRPGDTLSSLCTTYCKDPDDWKSLGSFNHIENNKNLLTGSKLQFPLTILKYQPARATVTAFSGYVHFVKHDQHTALPLAVNQSLAMGDHLITGNNSQVSITFADGSTLTLMSNSDIIMDTLSSWGSTGMVDTRIHLQNGRVETDVKPAKGPGSRYEIITPAAVAAVRGTQFRVASDQAHAIMRSEITQGTVSVDNKYRQSDVRKGFGLLAKKGEKLAPPRKLLPATNLQHNQSVYNLSPYYFDWPEINNGIVYQAHLSSHNEVRSYQLGKPELTVDTLNDGEYTLSVRGVDEMGLQGLSASFTFQVLNHPGPPALASEPENPIIRTGQQTLSWPSVPNVQRYNIQLADNPDFKPLLIEETVTGNTFTPPRTLAPGQHFWRVASRNAHAETGHFSQPAAFRLYPGLQAPATVHATAKSLFIDVSWANANGAQNYELQLSKDKQFEDIVKIINTQSTHSRLAKPVDYGTYYVRTRASNALGEHGPYSPVQDIELASPDVKSGWLFSGIALLLLLL